MKKNQYSIQAIFKRFRWKISITFLLLTLENIFKVVQPFVLGIAINDLLEKKNNGLWLFCILYAISFSLGVVRRYYDTRAYTFVYTKIASETVAIQQEKNVSVSTIAARSSLIKELVDFFEYDVTQAFTSLISVVGAFVMLSIFNIWISIACLLSILLIFIVYAFSNKKIYNFNSGLNNELERRVDVLERKQQKEINNHFKGISNWMVKLSDLETINFGIVEVILFVLAIFALYVSVEDIHATAGSIFSIITYVLEFSTGIFMLPLVFQQLIRLQEISARLKSL